MNDSNYMHLIANPHKIKNNNNTYQIISRNDYRINLDKILQLI